VRQYPKLGRVQVIDHVDGRDHARPGPRLSPFRYGVAGGRHGGRIGKDVSELPCGDGIADHASRASGCDGDQREFVTQLIA
jgi:hypothetical protein